MRVGNVKSLSFLWRNRKVMRKDTPTRRHPPQRSEGGVDDAVSDIHVRVFVGEAEPPSRYTSQ